MPAVLLVLAAILGGVQLGLLQLRLQDASADAARALGRGDAASVVSAGIARQAPSAEWSSSRSAGLVCVHLVARAAPPAGLVGVAATATSCAWEEVG